MKTKLFSIAVLVSSAKIILAPLSSNCATVGGQGQALTNDLPQMTEYSVATRGPHERVWQRIALQTNELGKVSSITNSYKEIATGLGHLVNGAWADSSDQITITSTGAEATNCQHQVTFLGNINVRGAVDLVTPDGKHLTSTIIGISYLDSASGSNVMISEIKDSYGQLLPSGNQALYPDAFTDFRADVLYQNSIAGLEQSAIRRQQQPSPAVFGLDPSSTLIQLITEFIDPPAPQVTASDAHGAIDEHLDFGAVRMGKGVAFALGSESNTVPVTKQWVVLSGRTCLVEQVPFTLLQPMLQALPAPPEHASREVEPGSVLHRVASQRLLPEPKAVRRHTPALKYASLPLGSKGVALDYSALSGSQTNYTFRSDTTYYVSSMVNLYSNTVIEGGAVMKFTNLPTAKLSLAGPITCLTGPYRMAVFTSKDDDSIGATISGSTGSPTNDNGPIHIDSNIPGSPSYTNTYRYLRFLYGGTALKMWDNSRNDVWHCHFVNCQVGVSWCDDCAGAFYGLHNVLCAQCGWVSGYLGLRGEHLTVDGGGGGGLGISGGLFTNSIFTGVTNLGSTANFDHCITNASSAGFYQGVGAGNYYLASGSTNRDAGTTNINSVLLADLKQKTTWPPLVCSNSTVAWDLILSPQAQRDTVLPDLGYHYDPVDFISYVYTFTNSTLTLTNGVV